MPTQYTVTKIWNFDSTNEGWQLDADRVYGTTSGRYVNYIPPTRLNTNGCLEVGYGIPYGGMTEGYIDALWSGTWTSLGVPSGCTIVGLRFISAQTRCVKAQGAITSSNAGITDIYFITGTTWIENATRYTKTVESSWHAQAGQSVVDFTAQSDSTAKFWMEFSFAVDDPGPPTFGPSGQIDNSGYLSMQVDAIGIEITYVINDRIGNLGRTINRPVFHAGTQFPAPSPRRYMRIVDDSDSAFVGYNHDIYPGYYSPKADPYNGGFKGEQVVGTCSNPSAYSNAVWTFDNVPNKPLDVWATWWAPSGTVIGYSGVVYTVWTDNDSNMAASRTVNQKYAIGSANSGAEPTDLKANGVNWVKLGQVTPTRNNINVHFDFAYPQTGWLADAVRVMEPLPLCTLPTFQDDFNENQIAFNWTTFGGTWQLPSPGINGYVAQTNASSGNYKLLVGDYVYHPNMTQLVKVRIDSWAGTDQRAGLTLYNDGTSGINFVIHKTAVGTEVAFLNDSVAWGNSSSYSVSVGQWYWLRLTMGSDGTLYGKVWTDGQSEPSSWTITQTGWAGSKDTTNMPGIFTACDNNSVTASFDSYQITNDGISVGCGSLTASHAQISGSGTRKLGPIGNSPVFSVNHPALSSSGSFGMPTFRGVAAISLNHPSLVTAGGLGRPNYHADTVLSVNHPMFSDDTYGMEAYWKFDNPLEKVAQDFSGNGNDATLVNRPSHVPASPGPNSGLGALQFPNSYSLMFDGFSQYLTFDQWFIPNAKSVSLWFYVSNPQYDMPLIFAGPDVMDPSQWSWGIWITQAGKVRYQGTVGSQTVLGDLALDTNTNYGWNHVGLVRTSTIGVGTKIYLNGQLRGNDSTQLTARVSNARLGKAGTSYLNGKVDDVRIYSRVLSDAEMMTLGGGMDLPGGHSASPAYSGSMTISKSVTLQTSVVLSDYVGLASSLAKNAVFLSQGAASVPSYSGSATLSRTVVFSTDDSFIPMKSGSASLSRQVQFFAWGHASANPSSSAYLTLFTGGFDKSNSWIPLFISGIPNKSCMPLYVDGLDVADMGMTLYTGGISGISNATVQLYLNASVGETLATTMAIVGSAGSMSGSIPLFLPNAIIISGQPPGLNLFVKQVTQVNSIHSRWQWFEYGLTPSPTLFVNGSSGISYNNILYPTPMPLTIKGFVQTIGEEINLVIVNSHTVQAVPFAIKGATYISSHLGSQQPLFVGGFDVFNNNDQSPRLSLVLMQNQLSATGSTPFFVGGPNQFNSHSFNYSSMRYNDPTLFVMGDVFKSYTQTTPLYLFAGGSRCETVNVFLKSDPVPIADSSLPMLVVGSVNPCRFNAVPLRIVGHGLNEYMNLIIHGTDSGGTAKIMKLTVTGGNAGLGGATPLFVQNDASGTNLDTELYIRGLGVNPGYNPYGESMNLFVERGPNAGITLYIENKVIASNVPFYIYGAPSIAQSASLFTEGFGGDLAGNVPFITQGQVPINATLVTTLTLPDVVGFQPSSATLYTNGFNY